MTAILRFRRTRVPLAAGRLAWHSAVLLAYRVPFVVVGGFATACFVANRVPEDFDLVVAAGPSSGAAAEQALIRLRLMSAALGVTDPIPTGAQIEQGVEVRFATRFGVLHVVGASLPDGFTRSALMGEREWRVVNGCPVPVLRLPALIALKEANGSDRDLRDATLLRAAAGRGSMA